MSPVFLEELYLSLVFKYLIRESLSLEKNINNT